MKQRLLIVAFALTLVDSAVSAPPKITIPHETRQTALRLQAADRLADAFARPEAATALIAWLASPVECRSLHAWSAVVSDRRTRERWEQALEAYERLLLDAGTTLAPAEDRMASASASVAVRRLCHARIAALPRFLLVNYRRHVDGAAAQLLAQGQKERDAEPLRRLVDDMFCSTHARPALDMLGDLAFERGRFEEALAWWSALSPLPSETETRSAGHRLLFPDGPGDPARLQAKQILALVFLNRKEHLARELTAFRKQHGGARGSLAGQQGTFVDILEKVNAQLARHDFFSADESWCTFAGGPTRQTTVNKMASRRLWADGPTWRVRLPDAGDTGKPGRLGARRQPSVHPVVLEDQILIAGRRLVASYDLLSGKRRWQYELAWEDANKDAPREDDDGTAFTTLSVSAGRAFVRLGKPGVDVDRPQRLVEEPCVLVCLDLDAGTPPGKRELWRISATGPWLFEGAPAVIEERVYFAKSRTAGKNCTTFLVCVDAGTGREYWAEEVCETSFTDRNPRVTDHLVTVAGNSVVFCTHAGLVAAVDRWTGQRLWALRYPVPEIEPRRRPGLLPCLYHFPLLYLAPADSDRLICLDIDSGRIIWEREKMDIVHILGVVSGKLIVATSTGVQALTAESGLDQGGWKQPPLGKLPSHGRGLLAGAWYLWPTVDSRLPFRAVTVSEGSQEAADGTWFEPTQLRELVAGNLAYAHGCLVSAGTNELVAYVPARRLLPALQEAATTTEGLHRLAQAQADAGLIVPAVLTWHALSTTPLAELARQSIVELHRELAGRGPAGYPFPLPKTPTSPATWQPTAPAKSTILSQDAVDHGGRDPTPLQPPDWRLDRLPLQHHFHLPSEHLLPFSFHDSDHCFLTLQGRRLSCWRRTSGKTLWSGRVAFLPEWSACQGERIFVAGAQGVQAFQRADGTPLWHLPSPALIHSRLTVQKGWPVWRHPAGELSGFVLTPWRLFFCFDQRRLFAVNPSTGRILWRHDAPAAAMYPLDGVGTFTRVLIGTDNVVVETRGQGLAVLEAETGRVRWSQSLVEGASLQSLSDDGHVLISAPAGVVTAFDGRTGQELWRHASTWTTGLTGTPAKIVYQDKALLMITPLNIGTEVSRLDPATGKTLWPEPLFWPRTLDDLVLSKDHVYLAAGENIACIARATGKLSWQRQLEGTWRLHVAGSIFVACPAPTGTLPILPGADYSLLTFPALRALHFPSQWSPIHLLDAGTGRTMQVLAEARGPAHVQIGQGGLLISRGWAAEKACSGLTGWGER